MTTPEKKISAFTPLDTIAENGVVVANQTPTGPTGGLPIPALRTRLNTGDQTFTADVDVVGKVSANQLEGNGALISGVVAAGTGGTSSTGSLQLVANSDNSTPAAKVQISKYSTLLADVDETGLELKTGIPYSHQDDYAPFDKGIDLGGNRMIRNQTIQDMHRGPYIYSDGVDDIGTVTDSTEFAELFKHGGTYICDFKALTAGESNIGVFFSKVHSLAYTGATGIIALTIDFSTTNGIWTSPATTLNKYSSIGISYDGSDVANNPILVIDGKEISLTETQTPVGTITTDVGTDLKLLNNAGGTATFHGPVRKEVFLNRAYTLNELIAATSSPEKPIDRADEEGSNTPDNVTNMANSGAFPYTSFTNETPSSCDVVSDGSVTMIMGTAIEIAIKKGNKYLAKFTETLNSGTAPFFTIADGYGGAPLTVEGNQQSVNGANSFVFTGLTDGVGTLEFFNFSTAADFSIDDLDVHQLGATLVLKSEDIITDKDGVAVAWKDSSGNSNHVTFAGSPSVGNRSEQQQTERGNWTVTNGDFGTWTTPAFTSTYKKSNGVCHLSVKQTAGTIDPGAAAKYITGVPFTPAYMSVGVASSVAFADLGLVVLQTDGKIYFTADIGPVTDLVFSITYQTEE